jgi:hypothetical protein
MRQANDVPLLRIYWEDIENGFFEPGELVGERFNH